MSRQIRTAQIAFALFLTTAAQCQTAQSPVPHPSAILQPSLSDIQSTTAALNISKWKAPGSVRDATQRNVDSIQRDLGDTLPALLAQADSAPESVPPSFAVYRNVDALYDVLLRISETANLAATTSESDAVASSLRKLETARAALGDSILHISQNNEAQLTTLRDQARSARPSPQQTETIIDDGAEPTKKPKKKTTQKKPATKPAAGTPAAPPSN